MALVTSVARSLILLCPLLLCAQNNGSISGRVTNSVTGAGIEGATVTACPTLCGGDSTYQVLTDAAGAFRIDGISYGRYLVMVGPKDGFAFLSSRAAPLPSVTVSGDSRLDLQMTPFASIRGRVLDTGGKPASDIAVKLSLLPATVTNKEGEFLFEAVPPGGGRILYATPKPQPTAKDGIRIVTTYYASVVDPGQAAMIAVAGLDLTYDIRLQTAPARALRGVVIGTDGKPAPDARVSIGRTERALISFVRGNPSGLPKVTEAAQPVVTAQDGTFEFPPVLEGEWVVRASLLSNGEIRSGAANVSVSTRDPEAGDIQNVEIRLVPPIDLEVMADWGDAPPPKIRNAYAYASIIPLDSQTDSQSVMRPNAEMGKPQQFHLFGGGYFIWEGHTPVFSPAPGFYAAAAMLGDRDVLGQVIELSGPASLKMIYKSNGGSVRGTVEKSSDCVVVLMADAMPAARVGYSARCDLTGTFQIPDLPPGEYIAVAVPGPYPGDPLRPEFVTALARDGRRVKVEAASTAQLDLRLSLFQ